MGWSKKRRDVQTKAALRQQLAAAEAERDAVRKELRGVRAAVTIAFGTLDRYVLEPATADR